MKPRVYDLLQANRATLIISDLGSQGIKAVGIKLHESNGLNSPVDPMPSRPLESAPAASGDGAIVIADRDLERALHILESDRLNAAARRQRFAARKAEGQLPSPQA